MRRLKTLYHFLGSVYFAIFIIAAMALVVTAGTFVESYTNSHQYAALATYNNPFFNIILVALFLNILISALRRWPFRRSHMPFLMTHLGLLMLISGVIVKNVWGIQGDMQISEGCSSQSITIPHTEVVRVEKRLPTERTKLLTQEYPIRSAFQRKITSNNNNNMPELSLEIVGFSPHCEEHWDSWIKNDRAFIAGLAPFSVYRAEDLRRPIPISTKVKFYPEIDEVWDVFAVVGGDQEKVLESIANGLPLQRSDPFETPVSTVQTSPKLLIFKDENQTVIIHAIDRYGHLATASFPPKGISPLIVYNEGFGGHFASMTLPFPAYPYDAQTVEEAKIHRVSKELRHQQLTARELSPPLQLLQRACKKTSCDFAYALAQIYRGNLPPDVSQTLAQIEWSLLPREPLAASPEIHRRMLLAAFDLYGVDLNFLSPNLSKEETRACLVEYLQDTVREAKLTAAFPPLQALPFQQKITVIKQLLSQHANIKQLLAGNFPEDALPIFSRPDLWQGLEAALQQEAIVLETPITAVYTSQPPTSKLEDNRATLTLLAKSGEKKELITLAYDPTGQQLKWPILLGEYRLSFQPRTLNIPLAVRLHDARQINYPHSRQPLSYEADLFFSNSQEEMTTISMNQVYESPEGYRFYLANITPSDESAVQQIQLAVNYDPAKYVLTYPGAFLIAIGTLLLFWFKGKGSKSP